MPPIPRIKGELTFPDIRPKRDQALPLVLKGHLDSFKS